MRYRAEIDGLRAVAVIPVILFHAGFPLFAGGYVGVDVFFVISGYLITTIIANDLDRGTFSLVGFYERRARRILPALFLVLVACLPFAWLWLLPRDMMGFSQSLIAVSFFASNVFFWRASGYFDTAAPLKPLLHTWSLAVEEQYYVLFPLLLLVAWRFGRRRIVLGMVVIAAVSLLLAQWASRVSPDAGYYLLPTRGWELLIGALVAFYMRAGHESGVSRAWSEAGALLGVLLVVGSVFAFDELTPYPSFYTLAPTLGAASIIVFANRDTWVGSWLGRPVLVGVGLVSYSAYLWHQPLFAFARLRSLDDPSGALMGLLAATSILLAYVSWRYVEAPFRAKDRFTRREVFRYSLVGSVGLLAVAVPGYLSDGFRARGKWEGSEDAFQVMSERGSGERYCRQNSTPSPLGPLVCRIGEPTAEPDGVLWGDSFGGALVHGLDAELRGMGRSFYFVSSNGCIPIEGVSRTGPLRAGCVESRQRTFVREVLRDPSMKTIVWIGAFGTLTGGQEMDFLIDGAPATKSLVKASILGTLRRFEEAGKTVVFVGDTPRLPYPASEYAIMEYARSGGRRESSVQTFGRADAEGALDQSDILEEASRSAEVVHALDLFCGPDVCSSHDANGKLLFSDRGHLSYLGSSRLAGEIARRLLFAEGAR